MLAVFRDEIRNCIREVADDTVGIQNASRRADGETAVVGSWLATTSVG